MPSFIHREASLERKLTADQISAAKARHARFVAACLNSHCPLSSSVLHRAYCECLEEQLLGHDEWPIAEMPDRFERRDYSKRWADMDWPT